MFSVGCLNVSGCNGIEKRDEIERTFEECRLNLLDLSKKELRDEGEVEFWGLEELNLGWGEEEM